MASQAKIREIVFQDIDMKLTAHPVTKKINILSNDAAVIRSVKNLVLTQQYEVGYRPEQYSGVYASLFEPQSPFTIQDIKKSISDVINTYEPRVQLLEVIILPDDLDNNAYNARIIFRIINNKEPTTVDIFLERIR